MKRSLEIIIIGLICTVIGLSLSGAKTPKIIDGGNPWSRGFNNNFGCKTQDITDMYAGYVEQWKQEVKKSFDEAEIQVYNITPTPDVVGPDEDPAKCICKGTGVIRQGDGHTTVCPYHGKTFNKPLLILER